MGQPSTTGHERRRHERISLRGIAHVLLPGHQPLEVRTIDISAGGMGIVASVNPRANLICVIRVAIPVAQRGSATVEVQAKVIHSILSSSDDGFKIGLQFVNLSASTQSVIAQFLKP